MTNHARTLHCRPLPLALLLLAWACLSTLLAQSVVLNEVVATSVAGPEDDPGRQSDWVELTNTGSEAVQLAGFTLSQDPANGGEFIFPDSLLAPGAYLIVRATGITRTDAETEWEAAFRISASGEAIYLFDDRGRRLDRSPAMPLTVGRSIGRFPDGTGDWLYHDPPTPAAPNTGPGYRGVTPSPRLSLPGGYYSGEIGVSVIAEADDRLYYTTDGSLPTEASAPYTDTLRIEETTSLRVRAFRTGWLAGEGVSASYLFSEKGTLPTVSLIIDPERFQGDTGIYKRPKTGEEVPLHLSFIEEDTAVVALGLGVKIHAPDGRRQKSLRLYARSGYGESAIDYALFPGYSVDRFRRVILRNGGNDGSERARIHLKDGYAHRLFSQLDASYAVAAYRPVRVVVNGAYFGLYNLRERQDEHYLESHFGLKPEEVDFLEYDAAEPNDRKAISGDWENWEALRQYVLGNDLSNEASYAAVEKWIDIDNFIDYQLFQIFIGNQDWLSNNIKFYRPRQPNGKWRWVLWDTEYGMGTQVKASVGKPDFDFLKMALSWGGWGREDWTWLLRGLVENVTFRDRFTRRYLDLLNSSFLPDYLLAELDRVREGIEPELAAQLDRWGTNFGEYEAHYALTQSFLLERSGFARSRLLDEFGISQQLHAITVTTDEPDRGQVVVNTLTIDDRLPGWQDHPYPWTGRYPGQYPITIRARPAPGYFFSHWEGDTVSTEAVLEVRPDRALTYRAVFSESGTDNRQFVVLNEIMSGNATTWPDEGGDYSDWFEIYNPTPLYIDLAGAYVTDDRERAGKWMIPYGRSEETTLPPGGYLIFFADGEPGRGPRHVDFKLSKDGEYLGLFLADDRDGYVVVDETTTPPLLDDQSLGRLPNGTGPWEILARPSPTEANDRLSPSTPEPPELVESLYPNPARGQATLRLGRAPATPLDLKLIGPMGRELRQWTAHRTDRMYLDLTDLPPAVYTLYLRDRSTGRASSLRIQLY